MNFSKSIVFAFYGGISNKIKTTNQTNPQNGFPKESKYINTAAKVATATSNTVTPYTIIVMVNIAIADMLIIMVIVIFNVIIFKDYVILVNCDIITMVFIGLL